ncbi:hypothetical protein HK405_000543, partial [Cladochytrium tenue]
DPHAAVELPFRFDLETAMPPTLETDGLHPSGTFCRYRLLADVVFTASGALASAPPLDLPVPRYTAPLVRRLALSSARLFKPAAASPVAAQPHAADQLVLGLDWAVAADSDVVVPGAALSLQ